jgi:hypothetical protein
MAAPTKFTRKTIDLLLAGIRNGLPYELAAEAAGIGRSTFYNWQRGAFPRGADKVLKVEFLDALTRARGESAFRLAGLINRAATGDWRAAAWMLERRFPKDFAKDADLYERLEAIEASLQDGQPIPIRRAS